MGSFNVACSVSHLSIDPGEKVVFIPLLPRSLRYYPEEPSILDHISYFTYPHDYYNPFCLPIKGEYGDYGVLQNIVRDETVETIEKFFGISIEQFIDSVTGRKGMTDTYSGMFEAYSLYQKEIKDYHFPFGEEYLFLLGFSKFSTFFAHPRFPDIHLQLFDGTRGCGYKLFNKGDLIKEVDYDAKETILSDYYSLTKFWLHVNEENQTKVKLIYNLAGMFVQGDIYDEMSKNPSSSMLTAYENMITDLIAFNEAKKNALEKFTLHDGKTAYVEFYEDFNHPFSSFGGSYSFMRYFQEWTYFKNLYQFYIDKPGMKNTFAEYISFYSLMYSSNTAFFPTVNGEQCGNPKVSKMILEKSLEIVNQKLKEREEDE